MNLRSINAGFNISRDGNEEAVRRASSLISEVRKAFEHKYPSVRTTRFCSQPLTEITNLQPGDVAGLVREIDRLCRKMGILWFCMPVGECQSERDNEFIRALPEIMSCSKISFSNVIVTQGRRMNLQAIDDCAKQIKNISKTDKSGFDNFRFCVSANVKPNGAFFPYSWHRGEDGFSLGLEAIDLILSKISEGDDLSRTRRRIMKALTTEFLSIDRVAKRIESKAGLRYYGLDLSLAPYPTESHSIGKAIQKLGCERFGANGTLFFTAYLTDMLKNLQESLPIRTVGFTGVMYPVLEDRFLAESNNKALLSMESLLLYSSVCGCGPDMIPLPGNVSQEEIASVILDMSSLALVLDKPLIARLVPIPGKKAGEQTGFDYHFFYNTRIMNVRDLSLTKKIFRINPDFEFF